MNRSKTIVRTRKGEECVGERSVSICNKLRWQISPILMCSWLTCNGRRYCITYGHRHLRFIQVKLIHGQAVLNRIKTWYEKHSSNGKWQFNDNFDLYSNEVRIRVSFLVHRRIHIWKTNARSALKKQTKEIFSDLNTRTRLTTIPQVIYITSSLSA